MALKRKIDKAAFDKLSSDFKTEYVEKDGAYLLDIDGDEDTGALKRAKDRETQARKDAEKRAEELQEKLDGISDTDSRKKGDIETLEKAWTKKADETKAQYEARVGKLEGYAKKSLIEGTAAALAAKISTVPALMSKAIRERLTVNFDGDEPTLHILDKDGKASAMTIEQLSEEFVANKDFSSIIVGSKASGGGAAKDGFNKQQNGGAGQQQQTDKPASFATMNPRALADQIKAKIEASKE